MTVGHIALRLCSASLCTIVLARMLSAAEPAPIDRLLALDEEISHMDRRTRELNAVLILAGERLPKGANVEVDAARAALDAARKEEERLLAGTDLPTIRTRLDAAEKARNDAIDNLAAPFSPSWAKTLARRAVLEGLIAAIEKKTGALGEEQLRSLAAMREERDALQSAIDRTHSTWRHAPEVEPLNKALWDIILDQQRPAEGKVAGLGEQRKKIGRMQKDLQTLLSKAGAESPEAKSVVAELGEMATRRAAATASMEEIRSNLLGKTPEWTHKVEIPQGPDKNGKPRPPQTVSLWLPPALTYVRGILICNSIAISGGLSKNPLIRAAAVSSGMAVILDCDGTFTGPEAPKRLQGYLTQFARQTNHPELDRIPLLTAGHSTGGIFARNVAYWDPDRVMGIVHINSGNMHQMIRPEHDTLAGVPFVAFNGEFEEFGPEGGGKNGIRAEYDAQTQWIMIREQILRRRRADPENLMSLVVTAGGGHGAWSPGDNRHCARFVLKCAQRRLPPPPADPTVQVRCVKVPAASGWLTDANIKNPTHSPAPFTEFKGDKGEAFWHFDEEMAKEVLALHAGMRVPEASGKYPIPADWGVPK